MRWTRFVSDKQGFWYLVESMTGKIVLAKPEDEMSLELWRMAR